jgi:hypothetical protein
MTFEDTYMIGIHLIVNHHDDDDDDDVSAILPPFLRTAAIRKIIVTLFKHDDILTA